ISLRNPLWSFRFFSFWVRSHCKATFSSCTCAFRGSSSCSPSIAVSWDLGRDEGQPLIDSLSARVKRFFQEGKQICGKKSCQAQTSPVSSSAPGTPCAGVSPPPPPYFGSPSGGDHEEDYCPLVLGLMPLPDSLISHS